MVIPVETVVSRLASLRIMHQHAAGGNVVGVVDVDFEIVDRAGFGAGDGLEQSRGAVEGAEPLVGLELVGADEGAAGLGPELL